MDLLLIIREWASVWMGCNLFSLKENLKKNTLSMLDKCSAITVGQDGLNTLVTNLTQPSQQS